MNIIQEIPSKETYIVRQPVLRKGKPIESCIFEGDDLNTTHHFGLFDIEKLIGIISLFSQTNTIFADKKQAQIRGMAILDSHQKKGFGEALVKHCENYCTENKVDLIWFNARTEAVGFYKKMNYQTIGKPFDIEDVGEHYLMFKKL
jgi:GNAT superfamily N-acetyltransferase